MSDDVAQQTDNADGIYKPFPSFGEWDLSGFDASDFDRYAGLLAAAKKSATPAALDAAMTATARYAAVDTNAIEGLYSVDRGFTRTVATQAAAWEAVMAARGPRVRPAFDDALGAYEYVLDAATESVEISELWIKELIR
jgi:Fic family protein